MSNIHEFIEVLHEILDDNFPNTNRVIIDGGDNIADVVVELRQDKKSLRYSPYDLYNKSSDYEGTIEGLIKQWKDIIE